MTENEFLNIHFALWQNPVLTEIEYRDRRYEIINRDTEYQLFRSVNIENRLIITQNLRKSTASSEWCLRHEEGKITWCIKDNAYIGKVRSWIDMGQLNAEVSSLNPNQILYQLTQKVA